MTGVVTRKYLEEMNEKIMEVVNDATDYAENAPYAPPEHALKYVYWEGGN